MLTLNNYFFFFTIFLFNIVDWKVSRAAMFRRDLFAHWLLEVPSPSPLPFSGALNVTVLVSLGRARGCGDSGNADRGPRRGVAWRGGACQGIRRVAAALCGAGGWGGRRASCDACA